MAEAQGDDEIFVYMGGDQEVPRHVRRVKIHKSVKIIPARAFQGRRHLIHVELHDEIEIIGEEAFTDCFNLLQSVKLIGVKTIKSEAFARCTSLTDVEFGDLLETIEVRAFIGCIKLTKITMHPVRNVGRRATLPVRDEMIADDVFSLCMNLASVRLVGGINKTVASLHLESWRNEMEKEINRINQILPSRLQTNTEIQQWMRSVSCRLDRFKDEHHKLLREATTLLELALWKANLNDNEGGGVLEREGVRTTRGRRKRARKEVCITSGASIVIKNVLPFLQLE